MSAEPCRWLTDATLDHIFATALDATGGDADADASINYSVLLDLIEGYRFAKFVPELQQRLIDRTETFLKRDTEQVIRIRELEAKLERLPANWSEDSSLETWFPFSAQEIGQLEAQMSVVEKIRKEREAVAALVSKSGWQPIETAPKDGTRIDLWMPSGRRVPNCFWGKPEHSCGEYEGYCDSCPDHDGWIDSEDFMSGYTDEEPTHWMPLPSSPARSTAEPEPAG